MEKLQIVCSAVNFSECVLKVVFKNPVVNVQTEYLSRTILYQMKIKLNTSDKQQCRQILNILYLNLSYQIPNKKQAFTPYIHLLK